MCERELETEQNCNILTPTLMAISVSFPLSWAAQPEAWGPSLSGTCSSIQHLISNLSDPQLQMLNQGPEAHSVGFWLSLPHLVSNWSCLQTDWISCALSYIIVQRQPSCGRHNRTHLTRPRSRLYSDIPWADAPVIYIGAFPILTVRPGRRSIYNMLS